MIDIYLRVLIIWTCDSKYVKTQLHKPRRKKTAAEIRVILARKKYIRLSSKYMVSTKRIAIVKRNNTV